MSKSSDAILNAALAGYQTVQAAELAAEIQQSILEYVKGQAKRAAIGSLIDELGDTDSFYDRVEEEGIPIDELQRLDSIEIKPHEEKLKAAVAKIYQTEYNKTLNKYRAQLASGTASKHLFVKLGADYSEAAGVQIFSLNCLKMAKEQALDMHLGEARDSFFLKSSKLEFTDWKWLATVELEPKQLKAGGVAAISD
jgi:hypothetical protein